MVLSALPGRPEPDVRIVVSIPISSLPARARPAADRLIASPMFIIRIAHPEASGRSSSLAQADEITPAAGFHNEPRRRSPGYMAGLIRPVTDLQAAGSKAGSEEDQQREEQYAGNGRYRAYRIGGRYQ